MSRAGAGRSATVLFEHPPSNSSHATWAALGGTPSVGGRRPAQRRVPLLLPILCW